MGQLRHDLNPEICCLIHKQMIASNWGVLSQDVVESRRRKGSRYVYWNILAFCTSNGIGSTQSHLPSLGMSLFLRLAQEIDLQPRIQRLGLRPQWQLYVTLYRFA
jgi:hypothetical protein